MILAAALPLLGDAAAASGAVPGIAARAVTGEVTRSAFIAMSRNNPWARPERMIAREATHQIGEQLHQQEQAPQPAPTQNPGLDQLLQNNDLTPFPNITRAMQESNGMKLLQHAFGSLNGQPLNPVESTAPPVDPKSLLTPSSEPSDSIQDGDQLRAEAAADAYEEDM